MLARAAKNEAKHGKKRMFALDGKQQVEHLAAYFSRFVGEGNYGVYCANYEPAILTATWFARNLDVSFRTVDVLTSPSRRGRSAQEIADLGRQHAKDVDRFRREVMDRYSGLVFFLQRSTCEHLSHYLHNHYRINGNAVAQPQLGEGMCIDFSAKFSCVIPRDFR